jgi:very-short-patch-repair endonuclease/predicted transcriptional regulator of viral defense system
MAVDPAVEREIGRLAVAQNGCVTLEQLVAAGYTGAAIKTRVVRGDLHRLQRGVYAVGEPALLPLAAESAAVLSLRAPAIISHRSAAAIWSIAGRDPAVVDVTVLKSNPRPRDRVRIHRVRTLNARDIRSKSNLALSSPARTLIDFAADASTKELERALAEARALEHVNDRELSRALERVPANHRGVASMRSLLARQTGRALTRSDGERMILSLIEAAQLPPPLVNVRIKGFTADFLWPEHRLVLEVDGYRFHSSRSSFESDRRRDQVLIAAGYRVIRVTWRQLEEEPLAVITRVAQALAARAA